MVLMVSSDKVFFFLLENCAVKELGLSKEYSFLIWFVTRRLLINHD